MCVSVKSKTSEGVKMDAIDNIAIENLPDDDDESLLLDESALLESLESLLSLLDELDECRLRLFDFFFLLFFELFPSLRASAFVLPLMADDASPRLGSAILILSARNE